MSTCSPQFQTLVNFKHDVTLTIKAARLLNVNNNARKTEQIRKNCVLTLNLCDCFKEHQFCDNFCLNEVISYLNSPSTVLQLQAEDLELQTRMSLDISGGSILPVKKLHNDIGSRDKELYLNNMSATYCFSGLLLS